ncbi:MAG: hypothetical protein U9R27_11510 [Campylobacterota bacterium]|nr:hypothetical protein [Campylobacterota bacterium]
MEKCTEIKALVRMEERYEALSLMFGDCPDLKIQIEEAINTVKKETGMTPFIFDKISNDRPDIQAIYIEFQDDIHRSGGDFFERVLKLLNIEHCESGLC